MSDEVQASEEMEETRDSVPISLKPAVLIVYMDEMSPPPGQVPDLVARAAAGDRAAVVELLERYRGRLRRMVAMRLDPRLQGRVDASDVIQEGYLDAMRRLEEFIRDPSVPFYIWLRFLVGQRVQEQHRRHLGTPGRDVGREVSIYRGAMPGASTGALAARLLGKLTSPSQAAMRAERKIRLQEALNRMDPLDREILVLRHYEQMTNGDAAAALGLEKSAASKRYTRALERLKEILAGLPGETRRGDHERADRRSRPVRGRRRVVPGAVPGRRAAQHRGVRRPPPRAGRADPRAAAGPGDGRAGSVDRPRFSRDTESTLTQPGHFLETLDRSIGSVPRVMLADTDPEQSDLTTTIPTSDAMPAPVEQGGRYQLFGEIARGGMGAVLKGRDADLGRDLAVKVLLEAHQDKPRVLRRFVEEAQIGGQLQHPGIVPVYELGTFADRRPFFSMKLVKGRTLADAPRGPVRCRPTTCPGSWRSSSHLPDDGLCPRPRRDPPRPEAVERDGGQLRRGPGDGLGPGQGPARRAASPMMRGRRRSAPEETRDRDGAERLGRGRVAGRQRAGHAGVHGARAGAGRDSSGSTSGPTSSAWARSSARSSPASRRSPGRTCDEIIRKAMRGDLADALARLDGCGAEAELIALAKDCLAAEPEDRPRDAGGGRADHGLPGRRAGAAAGGRARACRGGREGDRGAAAAQGELALAASVLALTTLAV